MRAYRLFTRLFRTEIGDTYMEKQFIVETSAPCSWDGGGPQGFFGEDGKLTVRAPLSQPGQFASNERVSIVGPKKHHQKCPDFGAGTSGDSGGGLCDGYPHLGIAGRFVSLATLRAQPGCKLLAPAVRLKSKRALSSQTPHSSYTGKSR